MTTYNLTSLDRRIKNILLKQEIVREDQIETVLQERDEKGMEGVSLGELLIESGAIDRRALLGHIAREQNSAPLDLERIQPDEEALECISSDLASYYEILPLSLIKNVLTIATPNPFDLQVVDDLHMITDCEIQIVIAEREQVLKSIRKSYGKEDDDSQMEAFLEEELNVNSVEDPSDIELEEKEEEEINISEVTEEAEDSKIVRLVNTIIRNALDEGVSDIHIEPFEDRTRVRFRKDGILSKKISPPKEYHNALVSRVKIMAGMDIADRRRPQDGKFKMQYRGRKIDFRVSVLPTVHGEKVVIRLLDSASIGMSLEELGFEEEALNHFQQAINEPWGMILVTGPTGSGKSTSLYSAIKKKRSPKENIVTVEDPVEYEVDGIVQVEINEDQGLTFANSLRSILRQDPDTVLVGEIRDKETADIAVKAALTGHMVFSTLHTNDAASAIARLTDMGVDDFMVSSSLSLVSAQRLLRELCDNCKEPIEKPDWNFLLNVGFREEEIRQDTTFYEANGCNQCNEGYYGRFAVLETIKLDDEIRKMILNGASTNALKEYAMSELDMITLRRSALRNVLRGRTSLEEALRVTIAD